MNAEAIIKYYTTSPHNSNINKSMIAIARTVPSRPSEAASHSYTTSQGSTTPTPRVIATSKTIKENKEKKRKNGEAK